MAKVKDTRGSPPARPSEPPRASGKFRIAVSAPSANSNAGSAPREREREREGAPRTSRPAKKSARARYAGKLAQSASACLERAMKAKTPASRTRHARTGLAAITSTRDVETQGLLLRQLYLGELEGGNFARAREVAEQLVALGVLPDVARHDAARACQALGALDDAIAHLREAARIAPEGRQGFHLSTLGSLLYVAGQPRQAQGALEGALATKDAAAVLVRGQLALAKHAAGDGDGELDLAYHELVHDRSGEGYGRFVLGELAFARGDRRSAQIYLQAFLSRVRRSRPAAQAALSPEVARATTTLGRITLN